MPEIDIKGYNCIYLTNLMQGYTKLNSTLLFMSVSQYSLTLPSSGEALFVRIIRCL